MEIRSTPSLFAVACLAGVMGTTGAMAKDCPKPPRQPATNELIRLVNSDIDLKHDLVQSIAMGRRVNADPKTNPIAGLEDYYDFIDALVTYNPQNMSTGAFSGAIRVGMDGKNYCNWNVLDLISYSYFLVDRQLTTDPRGQIQFKNANFRPGCARWQSPGASIWKRPRRRGTCRISSRTRISATGTARQDRMRLTSCSLPGNCAEKRFRKARARFTVLATPGLWCRLAIPPLPDGGRSAAMESWSSTYDGVAQSGRLIKGKLYSDVHSFIAGEPGETVLDRFGELDPKLFDGGTWTHQFLNVNNYHRLHVPVSGKLIYLRHFQSGVRMKSGWKAPIEPGEVGQYDPQDTADWQFGQTRMVIGITDAEERCRRDLADGDGAGVGDREARLGEVERQWPKKVRSSPISNSAARTS